MSLKVVILESAEHDLKELRSYIVKNFSLKTWQNTYDKIKEVIRNLKTFPYTGSIPEEIEKLLAAVKKRGKLADFDDGKKRLLT